MKGFILMLILDNSFIKSSKAIIILKITKSIQYNIIKVSLGVLSKFI